MTNAERVRKMAQEISDIAEWKNTKLRKEKHFNIQSIGLFLVLVGIPALGTFYFFTK